MLHDNNLIEMSLRHNRSEPLFRTVLELPGIGRRPRQKPDQTFIFRILLAKN